MAERALASSCHKPHPNLLKSAPRYISVTRSYSCLISKAAAGLEIKQWKSLSTPDGLKTAFVELA